MSKRIKKRKPRVIVTPRIPPAGPQMSPELFYLLSITPGDTDVLKTWV